MSEINDLLESDPLAEAERVTGISYKEDPDTLALGMLLAMSKNAQVAEEMGLRDDTHYGSSFADGQRIMTDLGFEVIHSHEFYPPSYGDDAPRTETFLVLWRAGVLAVLTSYGEKINDFKIYYNWQANEDLESIWEFTASGRLNSEAYDNGVKIWVGDHDVRTGLRHILNRMESNGRFLETWVERPWLWFVDYAQTKNDDYDHKAITNAVIETFPEHVRQAMGSQED